MVYSGYVQNGVVVLDGPDSLPEGAVVSVLLKSSEPEEPLLDENGQTLGQKLAKYSGRLKGLPSDLARNHDHYIHGTPKP